MTAELSALVSQHTELVAVIVLLLGLALATLISRGLDRIIVFIGNRFKIDPAAIETLTNRRAIRRTSFWLVLLLAVLIVLRMLGDGSITDWWTTAIAYGTQLLWGIIIVIFGASIATLVRETISHLGAGENIDVFARIVYYLVIAFATISAFHTIGIDVFWLLVTFITVLAIILVSLGLSFSLGTKEYVANLVSRSALERISIGDRLRIEGYEGAVVHIHSQGLDLRTDDGTVSIPAVWFTTHAHTKLNAREDQH